jgi:glycosidase
MPDLNYNNPQVTDFANRISEYWLDEIGVDGFRVDAAKHLIEQDGQIENTPATHNWYKDFYETYKNNNPTAYTVGEVFGAGGFIAKTYKYEFDHIFNFELASGIVNSVSGESNTGINSALNFTLKDIDDGDYAPFLTNHDQNRVMSVLNGSEEKAKLAAFILLTSPGTPFIYYGEEIGMQGKKPDEDIRLPMQWSGEENAGFSGSKPWRGPDANYPQVNVALQENDPDSLLSHYRELIQLRKEHSALRTGQTNLLETGNSGVYAILRSEGSEHLLVLANLTKSPIQDYALTLDSEIFANGTITPEALFGNGQGEQATISNKRFKDYKPLSELLSYQAYIFQLK